MGQDDFPIRVDQDSRVKNSISSSLNDAGTNPHFISPCRVRQSATPFTVGNGFGVGARAGVSPTKRERFGQQNNLSAINALRQVNRLDGPGDILFFLSRLNGNLAKG